ESLHRGKEHAASDLEAPVARSVPGFALHLGLDAHRDPGFAPRLLDSVGTGAMGGAPVRPSTKAAGSALDGAGADGISVIGRTQG
ncbi:MAG: hypothetical protein RL698_1837, partial [Pseudomonadota bacterium]